jgi:hypothetical protein
MMAVVALIGVSLAATAAAGSAPFRLYTVAATEACLKSLPDAITGLPPATPPSPRVSFVYRVPSDRFRPPVRGQLGAWYGQRGKGAYAGGILSFFMSIQAARTHVNKSPYTGSRTRNVVAEWDHASVSDEGWQKAVRGCLRAVRPAGTPPPARSTPRASLATFGGSWGGHTRRLRITPGGRGLEITDSGCCFRVYRMTFQILSVSGTLTRATAVYRVTSFKRHDRAVPKLHTGQVGKLLLRSGIVTNTLTRVFFCSYPAWRATGACGA